MRIVYLPVDERFCTRDYFLLLAQAAGIEVKTPPLSHLGAKKVPPDMERLRSWLEGNADPGDLVILSLDMLVHGGLLPSRMSLESLATLRQRLGILRRLKERGCRVYAAISVTRTPFYNSAEEEPDYWEYYGERIYDLSRLLARRSRGEEVAPLIEEGSQGIPRWIIEDYTRRRERNFALVSSAIDLVAEGAIDFLNLVLDDNSAESISLAEAEQHGEKVASLGIGERVVIHAGADESTLTLLAKSLVDEYGLSPTFEVVYASPEKAGFIPPYEGSPLREGVKNHVDAAGGRIVDGGGDVILVVNNPEDATESPMQPATPADAAPYERIARALDERGERILGIADVRYVNGADNHLVRLLLQRGEIDWERANFAGWNTAGNTLGTVCAHSIVESLGAKGILHLDRRRLLTLQGIFLIEHWGFQANVRQGLIEAAKEKGVLPWTVIPLEDWAVGYTTEGLVPYKEEVERALATRWGEFEVWFPWHRSFEIGIALR